ncbi:adhesion G-protein coupled receptor G4 [Fundulus heteroclitus]|uniref:adhesion G-protein coupled receptor G4 n=1 Tax=Fundulus heteroclitus TaxID=8078 RepID=UPI00165A667D|nr:adhesion G-protein coupled receptor G4 [Fundulus heteroclitus]
MAVKRNASYIGILLFPGIPQISATSFLFNNQIVGIEMGVNISNLSETIDINFNNVNRTGFSVSCVSWDGRSKRDGADNWITDGCKTKEADDSVICQCSHLTFFAILMTSSGTRNISSSDLKTLTQITKAGCGMSLFFLGVALFMHFLMRKTKASQAVNVLMNLFIALFILNLCFLINESIANLKIFAACVAIAVALHYSMLATFTWFFMQALHLCWIPDYSWHLGVNTGYYGIVFLFTLTIFIVTVVHITQFASKAKNKISTKKRVFSLLGLFSLLGITWGFAFFSYGPLLLPSYYIFTILNSFQGFFLFVYYYFSSRINPEDKNQLERSSHTTEHVYITSPYA